MKLKFSLKQIFGLAILGSVVWGIVFFAYWGNRWANGVSLVLFQLVVVCLLTWLFMLVLDRVAFLLHRRQ